MTCQLQSARELISFDFLLITNSLFCGILLTFNAAGRSAQQKHRMNHVQTGTLMMPIITYSACRNTFTMAMEQVAAQVQLEKEVAEVVEVSHCHDHGYSTLITKRACRQHACLLYDSYVSSIMFDAPQTPPWCSYGALH